MRRVFSYLLIFIGISVLIYAGYLSWERIDPSRLAFITAPAPSKIIASHILPTRILIKKLQVNVPLYPASIHKNIWETTTQGASFLTSSPLPGERGNSILYAHNWTNLFGNLVMVKPGDLVTVMYKNNTKKTFIITYTAIIAPKDVHILDNSKDTRITLFTCTGFLDMNRFVAVGLLSDKP